MKKRQTRGTGAVNSAIGYVHQKFGRTSFVNTTLYRGFVAPLYRRQLRCFAQRAGVGKVLPWA